MEQAILFVETVLQHRDGRVRGDECDGVGLVLDSLSHPVGIHLAAVGTTWVFGFGEFPFDKSVFVLDECAVVQHVNLGEGIGRLHCNAWGEHRIK